MALLQISEPGQAPLPHERKVALGIDLGTTNSVVATMRSGSPEALPDAEGKLTMPSVVRYHSNGSIELGHAALAAVNEDSANVIQSVKRLMGRGLHDVAAERSQFPYPLTESDGGMVRIGTCAGDKSPVQVSADILHALLERGRAATLGGSVEEVSGAVITVPAYFDDTQRQATKEAARLAGINVLRLLNEPTAAAIAYGLQNKQDATVVVYDLGGGTFDVSVLRLENGVFEVLATGGDTHLGGDDFDHAIVDWMLKQIDEQGSQNAARYTRLAVQARRAKEALSQNESVSLAFDDVELTLTREDFHGLIDDLVSRTLKVCKQVLRDAELTVAEIDEVVLVGGSTRVPRVRERITDLFQKQPLGSVDPDLVVAFGAAIQADILIGNQPDSEMLLLDVIPLSLGIETMGGMTEKIIHRNTTIPIVRAQEFTTYQDGQTAMAVHVVQGEREMAADCRSLARFELRGIPPMVAGAARIKVTYQVDADGILTVSATEESTGVEAAIEVKPSFGLSESEIASMIESSFIHAEQDKQQRALEEQRVEATQLIAAIEAAVAVDQDLLSESEHQRLNDAIATLQTTLASDDVLTLRRDTEYLSSVSEEFAARRMDRSVKKALAGHSVSEFEDQEN